MQVVTMSYAPDAELGEVHGAILVQVRGHLDLPRQHQPLAATHHLDHNVMRVTRVIRV